MKAAFLIFPTALIALAGCIGSPKSLTPAERMGGYAVVVSEATLAEAGWETVVKALESNHFGAQRIIWKETPAEARDALAKTLPRYTCFVARPQECGHTFTVTISRFMRQLDDDPYVDSLWGVITGYEAADALSTALQREPLILERALDCAGTDTSAFPFARNYDETRRGTVRTREPGQTEWTEAPCDTDNTLGMLEMLQNKKIDFLATSAHATQHDWHMGYRGPNLVMTHKDGMLLATDTRKKTVEAPCPTPKVYIAAGNCLIGDIDRVDCMATAWMHSGGARQFVGYTVPTWFGAQGWGTLGMFTGAAGLYTCAEAFHFTNTRIIRELGPYATRTPATYDTKRIRELVQPESKEKMEKEGFGAVKNEIGNLFDRDVVCFYGDPAWRATPPARFRTDAQTVEDVKGNLTLIATLTALSDTTWPGGGAYIALPGSFTLETEKAVVSEPGLTPFYADNFIHLPLEGACTAGQTITITLPVQRKRGK